MLHPCGAKSPGPKLAATRPSILGRNEQALVANRTRRNDDGQTNDKALQLVLLLRARLGSFTTSHHQHPDTIW
jgi:hypothetical protein